MIVCPNPKATCHRVLPPFEFHPPFLRALRFFEIAFLGFFDHICSSPDLQRLRSHVDNHCLHFGTSISALPLRHYAQLPIVSISNPVLQPHRLFIPQLTSRRGAVIRAQAATAASGGGEATEGRVELRTCRNCKKMYNSGENHPRACRFHTAHFGGETKKKFESVYMGGTMEMIGGGEILQYWHCCGVTDAFDFGCEAAPHMSYDD